ncbi:TolC family protein [Granulosicoccus antarcticus]|uniref:TolC family protein n=1 Tax=Granulosicoccus antarcticus TaxID=437505 RepID=UPI0012FE4069|nr:TolC family protein [Granulosicoccus antarcticus]
MHADTLSLDNVIKLVVERDLEIGQSMDRESMLRDTARVSAALPPPTLKLSAANFPLDTFAIDQEPMTQLQISLSQMFPPGDSRHWQSTAQQHLAQAAVIQSELRRALLRQQLQTAWSEGWMAQASVAALQSNRTVFEQALDITRANYGAGLRQARQREVLSARAALTRVDERIERFSMLVDNSRELFGEWLSAAEIERLDFTQYNSDPMSSSVTFDPSTHPSFVLADAERKAAEAEQRLATELGKGSRGLSVSYGYREDPSNDVERADFLSLGFTMDLASLRGGANTARRSAATAKVDQADKKAELIRDRLSRDYRQLQAQAIRLEARQTLLRDELLPEYHQQAEATRRAFASGEAGFVEVQLVLIDRLNAELETLALDAELMKTKSAIEYVSSATPASGERS